MGCKGRGVNCVSAEVVMAIHDIGWWWGGVGCKGRGVNRVSVCGFV